MHRAMHLTVCIHAHHRCCGKSCIAYEEARKATKEGTPLDTPLRLGLALNFSVFY